MEVSETLPGRLRLLPGTPNPAGAEGAELWLVVDAAGGAPRSAPRQPDEGAIPPRLPDLSQRPFRLTVLHFNDLHGQATRAAPDGDRPLYSRLVGRARELRRQSLGDPRRAVLLLAGGDDLAGSPLGELAETVHAGYRLYSAAGVDAAVVGNHDLNLGAGRLVRAIQRDARFPLLSANACRLSALAGQVLPAVLLIVNGLRVGLIGLTTRAELRAVYQLDHPRDALQNLLPALRPLCDVLIVLSHLGHSLAAAGAVTCDLGDRELAASLPAGSVDLIVGGHSHQALNEHRLDPANVVAGIPIVQAGAMGAYLGQVELAVGEQVSVVDARLTPTDDPPADETFEREQVAPLLAMTRPLLARPLGRAADQPDLTAAAVQAGLAAAESALANLVADGLVAGCRAHGYPVDLAAVDASSLQGGLPAGGELTFGDWFQLMPYADVVRLYRLTGRDLAALLDDNARRADRPGEAHVERGFVQFSRQVRYVVELGESRDAARAVEVAVDGRPLAEQLERGFLLAAASFLRQAAIAWERDPQVAPTRPYRLPTPQAETDQLVRDLLVAHLLEHGGATEAAGARRDGRLLFRPGR